MAIRRRFALAPGAEVAYVADDWNDSLVVVEAGSIELESLHGVRRTFVAGDMLSLQRLALRVLRNRGRSATVLAFASRRKR